MQSGISEISRAIENLRVQVGSLSNTLDVLAGGEDDVGAVNGLGAGSISGGTTDASSGVSAADQSASVTMALEREIAVLKSQLENSSARENELRLRLADLEKEEAKLDEEDAAAHSKWFSHQQETIDFEESNAALEKQIMYMQQQLRWLKRTNVLNEAFHISHEGSFACINGLRLGRLPDKPPVPWAEINAALGQISLLLDVLVRKCHVPLVQHRLLPRGSYSAIIKKDDRSTLELFTGEGGLARFFSGRKFDAALTALLQVMSEIIVYFQRSDRAIRIPYKIEGDKIGGVPVTLQFNSEEKWTQAMKYVLTDAKWLITWVVERGLA